VLAAFLEDGLPGLAGIGQHRRIDVDDDLVAFGRRTGIESLMECDLGEETERIGLLLFHGRGLHGLVHETHGGCRSTPPLVEGLPGGVQSLDEKRADLGLQPALEDEHAVVRGEEVVKPVFQPPRASNSRISSRRRAVAASRCAASSAISSPSRSSAATFS
jgi:hypothetical protein